MNSILTLFQKEVASFFNSLIGYLVISVFLVGVSMFLWVFEGSILETGLANLDALFDFGPYLFLFLVPAITMRAFSEEIKTGTIEFLATKPLTDWHIILGKYLAAVFLVFFSLLPTLIYYLTIYLLGRPTGNLDQGAIWGAYIGLFSLGAIFAAIGVFTSALSDNQIVSFIAGVFLCFMMFLVFDMTANLSGFEAINSFLIKFGIMEHYRSISRGVIDTRDILYFFSIITIFLILTKIVLNKKRQ